MTDYSEACWRDRPEYVGYKGICQALGLTPARLERLNQWTTADCTEECSGLPHGVCRHHGSYTVYEGRASGEGGAVMREYHVQYEGFPEWGVYVGFGLGDLGFQAGHCSYAEITARLGEMTLFEAGEKPKREDVEAAVGRRKKYRSDETYGRLEMVALVEMLGRACVKAPDSA
jgi:hypothetical protein